MRHMSKKVSGFLSALAVTVCATAGAYAEETIPATGADVSGFITAGITAMGAVAAVAIGGYFAFLIIRKGLKWAGKALG